MLITGRKGEYWVDLLSVSISITAWPIEIGELYFGKSVMANDE